MALKAKSSDIDESSNDEDYKMKSYITLQFKKFMKNANAKGFNKDQKQSSSSQFKSQDKGKKDAKDGVTSVVGGNNETDRSLLSMARGYLWSSTLEGHSVGPAIFETRRLYITTCCGTISYAVIGLSLSPIALDFSANKFTDVLPIELLNLSYNDFDGEVPTNGVFKNTSATVIKGNIKLYGGMPKFDLSISTNAFSTTNLIGVGSFGSVNRGILDHDRCKVAIKVFNLLHHGASKSFIAECEALRNIRHWNLVKVFTACSGVDYQGHDFKALPSNVLLDDDMIGHVGDFGLARFLREATQKCLANQSSSIGLRGTIGYAPPKYGLENEMSTYGDVYSYGILLLEMFIGKRPTDNIFKDNLNLHDFVKGALPERVINIVDPIILWEREDMETMTNDTHIQSQIESPKILGCLILIFGIGVSCSIESPRERMNINDVVAQLHLIREKLLRTRIRQERLQHIETPLL
ncbi:receptor kinase-like protein Xa21 [Quercus lobata]|uniref:receptor kinase-like protein Xa21 n=1 Tax=Quercus lobata TaxID=97700 RepID=UPI001247D049|nr:receptor kinase-like protein Xa21 [Quercus lobata]